MTINFALSLSHEGIELLQRVQSGWRRLGRVDVTSDTLDADLVILLENAQKLAPEGFYTKLIIPEAQIKYTAIDSTQTEQADIDAVLIDATPYALDELVVDCERFGGRTHIAAVAQETLAEAEAFATGHGFNPVAFVAIPTPFTFQSEVFFGPTQAMPDILGPDATVTRDSRPVMIAGTRLKSRLLVMDAAEDTDEDDLAELLQTRPTPAAPDTPDATAPTEAASNWVDAVPPEYWPQPVPIVENVTEQAPTAPVAAQEPSLAVLPLYDLVIPEVHPKPVTDKKPALVAVSQVSATPAPKLAAEPARARPEPAAPTRRKTNLAVAASVAVAAVAFGWSSFAPAPDTSVASPEVVVANAPSPTPVEVAPPKPSLGPEVFALSIPRFGATVPAAPTLPVVATTQAPTLEVSVPIASVAAAPDAGLIPVQAPPPPTVSVVVQAADVMPQGTVLSPDQAAESYATTGVWQRAPRLLDTPAGTASGITAPNALSQPLRVGRPNFDASPPPRSVAFGAPRNPPPPEAIFDRDENGFIAAAPDGTLTPQGAIVFAGLPDIAITPRPELSPADLERLAMLAPAPANSGVIIIPGRPDLQPTLRPADFSPPIAAEVARAPDAQARLGGVGLASLEVQDNGSLALDTEVVENRAANDLRPQLRPARLSGSVDPVNTSDVTDILTEIAANDATLRFDNSTSLAVRASMRPTQRPSEFGAIVAAAVRQPDATSVAAAPIVAAAPVPPQNFEPVPGGVARAATQEDVIRLRDINLIGVYGRPNARRALVRLGNGRYVRVEVGSALDGGQVTAIGDEALNYVKRGRTYAVEMPSG